MILAQVIGKLKDDARGWRYLFRVVALDDCSPTGGPLLWVLRGLETTILPRHSAEATWIPGSGVMSCMCIETYKAG